MSSCKKSETGRERKELGPSLYSFPVVRHTLFFCTKQIASLLFEYSISRRTLRGILSGYEPFSAAINSIS